jgi:hypothetical protein
MTNKTNSNIIEEIVDIIDDIKLPIKKKRELINLKLKTISSILSIFIDKESVKKRRKIKNLINNISYIKTNVELRKIFNLNLLYNLLSYDDNLSLKKEDEKKLDMKLIDINDDSNSKINKNNQSDTIDKNENIDDEEYSDDSDDQAEDDGEDSDDEDSDDEDSDEEDSDEGDIGDDETDVTDNEEDTNEDIIEDTLTSSNEINYLINDLPDKEKVKLVLRITKLKNNHTYNMQLEMNRHKECINDKKLKEIKLQNKLIKNKYKYKLEVMKEKNRYK